VRGQTKAALSSNNRICYKLLLGQDTFHKQKDAPMNVSLTRELEHFVNKKVKTGMYQSASEVIRAGLRLLIDHEEAQSKELAELRTRIAVGIRQLENGQYSVYSDRSIDQLVDKIRSRGRKRLVRNRTKQR
jgi:antitoxin ParD1/3/4